MPRIGGLAALDDVVPSTRTVTTTAPLAGGGDLKQNRTLTVTTGTSSSTVAAGDHGHGVATLTATGTRDATTFLRGDNTWAIPAGSGGTLTVTTVKTGNYTAAAGEFVRVDVSGGNVTLTLPTNPPGGTRVGWKIVNAGNTLTVARGGTVDVFTRAGGQTSITAILSGQAAIATFEATDRVWLVQSSDLPLTQLDARYAAIGSVGGGSTPDATTTAKGILRLSGDLAGTADAPTVPGAQKLTGKSTAATPVANGYIGADSTGITPAALLPPATTSVSGIVRLAGDLGGTAANPVVVRRGPVGGNIALTYAATITVDATSGNNFYVTATGNITLAAPTGGVDGQNLLIEVFASGGARNVTFSGTTTVAAGIGTTLTVATSKVGFVGMRYSARVSRWVVLALSPEA